MAADNAAGVRRRGRPAREVPADFAERFPALGWELAPIEWRCHPRSIVRWVDECGRDRLVLARKAYKTAERAVQARARQKGYRFGRE